MASVIMLLFPSFLALLLFTGPLTVCSETEVENSEKATYHVHDAEQEPPVAVQGVVYCKPCKYQGVNTLGGASPMSGASVTLTCQDPNHQWNKPAVYSGFQTDKNGYFFVQAPYLRDFMPNKCWVNVSPVAPCDKNTYLNMKNGQAFIEYKRPSNPDDQFNLYTVGPFAYEPSNCPH